jgi:NAD(P)-dependent dehydrogenase (short-subunit alcohol dehydrogenase family)
MDEEAGMKELAIITGCDSGIGRSLCAAALDQGLEVLASYLDPAGAEEGEGLFKARMDLRNPEEIRAFAGLAGRLTGEGRRLSLIVMNAGVSAVGAAEHLPLETLREVFEVNFFGTFSLVQALIPLARENRSRICLVSSAAGRIALPYFSPYTCSKFAIEGLGDTLRRELSAFGVKVIIFEPRAIATPIWGRTWSEAGSETLPLTSERYRVSMERGALKLIEGAERGMGADEAARFMLKKAKARRPAPRYIVSRNRLLAAAQMRVPARAADRLIAGIFSRG